MRQRGFGAQPCSRRRCGFGIGPCLDHIRVDGVRIGLRQIRRGLVGDRGLSRCSIYGGLVGCELVGREFVVPGTMSDDEDSCMSLLYYCEHEALRDNRIKVVSRDGDRFWLRWTAVVRDVNYYDGSKPPTQVEIEGEFVFKDISKWVRA